MINYSKPHITNEDVKAITDALQSDWIAGRGVLVDEFQRKICEYTGYKYAVAVNSATSGLYLLSLFLLDHFDSTYNYTPSIFIPDLTFVASMNAPLLAGFKEVVLVDVNENFTTDYPTSWFSNPMMQVSYAGINTGIPYGEFTITDHAHRLFPDMGKNDLTIGSVISTHAIKPITTAEGGVVLTNRQEVYDFVRRFSDHGYAYDNYGHNFRMPSLNAALGLSQLKRADSERRRREEIAHYYIASLKGMIKTQNIIKDHTWHIFPIILNKDIDTDVFKRSLFNDGINTQKHYMPLHKVARQHKKRDNIKINGSFSAHYKNSLLMWNHGFSLPMHSGLTDEEVEKVIKSFKRRYYE